MRIFVEIVPYFNRNVTDDKKYLFNCLKQILAPWRVLGIDKCGSLRSPQPSTRHNKEMIGNPNRKHGGAEPSPLTRLGNGCRFFRRAWLSFFGFCRSLYLLNLPFRSGYGSIAPRASQRPQNRCLKHLYKEFESRVRIVFLARLFCCLEAILRAYNATILALSR
mgnify:CR=1 FL=1